MIVELETENALDYIREYMNVAGGCFSDLSNVTLSPVALCSADQSFRGPPDLWAGRLVKRDNSAVDLSEYVLSSIPRQSWVVTQDSLATYDPLTATSPLPHTYIPSEFGLFSVSRYENDTSIVAKELFSTSSQFPILAVYPNTPSFLRASSEKPLIVSAPRLAGAKCFILSALDGESWILINIEY
jgi:hypothetical protein